MRPYHLCSSSILKKWYFDFVQIHVLSIVALAAVTSGPRLYHSLAWSISIQNFSDIDVIGHYYDAFVRSVFFGVT